MPSRVSPGSLARQVTPRLAPWLLCLALFSSPQATAQLTRGARDYPSDAYYLAVKAMDKGEYVSAGELLQRAARTGLRRAEGPWVDSVCYFTMLGECYYQMGDLARALEQYSSAVQLYLANSSFLLAVEFRATLEPRNTPLRTPVTWGSSQRRSVAARFTNRYPILYGTNPNQVVQQGGVLMQPEYIMVNAHEVARCTARAIRRRAEIMGAACPHDPLTEQLVQRFAARPAPPGHWSQAWIDCLLGLSYLSAGRPNEATAELTKSLQIAGQFDHPLTGEALLALGKLAVQQQQYGAAAAFFQEATFSACWFDHVDVMSEAFLWGSTTHLISRAAGVYSPLAAAQPWARRERATALEATLLISQAQQAAEFGETAVATASIERARRSMARAEMVKGAAGARLSYVAALTAFQAGNLSLGEAAWVDVLAYQTNPNRMGSHRLFEIGLVDAAAASGRITPRVANDLYAAVLREPTPLDWTTSPVEAMATILFPPYVAYERWLQVALERDEIERAAEIADRIRRLRFYSTLPMGGRILALSWTLAAPQETLPESTRLIRQDLTTRFPKFAELSRRAVELRDALRAVPLGGGDAGKDADTARDQQKAWGELASLSQTQELMLREIALRREPSDFAFPPPLDCKQLQERLPAQQAVASFLVTSQNQLHGFLFSRSGCRHWRIDVASRLVKEVSELLRQFGQYDRNSTVDLEVVAASEWQKAAASLWQTLTAGSEIESAGQIEELVIVPDRFLWYLPFEALPLKTEEGAPPMLSELRVRYAPTVSLAVPDSRPVSAEKTTLVAVGKMFTTEDTTDATQTAEQLRKVLGDVVELKSPLPVAGSLLASLGKRTLVLHDAGDAGRGVYDLAPMQLDQDKIGNSLASWIALPWGAPEQIAIPGFHSGAETALRKNATGDELFLTTCGLMATGARTVLISRWRTGGQSAFDLSREFVQELPFASPPNAWQRSVQLLWEKELRFDREPRIRANNPEASIKATHPFFWAGYLLIDTGAMPKADAE